LPEGTEKNKKSLWLAVNIQTADLPNKKPSVNHYTTNSMSNNNNNNN
jgi:hypothetical protein